MTTRHIQRFVPAWCNPSQRTFCKMPITENTTLVTVPVLEAAALNQHGTTLQRMLMWVGDDTFQRICVSLDICQLCLRAQRYLRSWDEDPLRCMAQHAAFIVERGSAAEQMQHMAELVTICGLVAGHRDVFDRTVQREKSILALRGVRR